MAFQVCYDPQSDGTGGLGVTTERMRIKSNGNVGIGTTVTDVGCQLKLFNSTYGGQIGLCNGQQTDTSAYLRLGMDSVWTGYIALNGYWNGSSFQAVNGPAYGGFQAARMSFGSPSAAFMTFDTASGPSTTTTFSWTERMRIANSGNVSIGTTNSSAPLHVSGIVAANINAFNYYNYTFPQAGVYTVILEYAQFSDTNIIDGWTVTVGNGNNPTVTSFSGNKSYLRANVVSQYVVGFGSANSLPGGYNNSNYNLRVAFLCAH
jgi:hypothetical protein